MIVARNSRVREGAAHVTWLEYDVAARGSIFAGVQAKLIANRKSSLGRCMALSGSSDPVSLWTFGCDPTYARGHTTRG